MYVCLYVCTCVWGSASFSNAETTSFSNAFHVSFFACPREKKSIVRLSDGRYAC